MSDSLFGWNSSTRPVVIVLVCVGFDWEPERQFLDEKGVVDLLLLYSDGFDLIVIRSIRPLYHSGESYNLVKRNIAPSFTWERVAMSPVRDTFLVLLVAAQNITPAFSLSWMLPIIILGGDGSGCTSYLRFSRGSGSLFCFYYNLRAPPAVSLQCFFFLTVLSLNP